MRKSGAGRSGVSGELPYEVRLAPPPSDLADLVNTFFEIRIEAREIEEVAPAYSAQLLVFASGHAVLQPEVGIEYRSAPVCFSAPLLEASPVTFEGPAQIFGASLTALGWQALSSLPADEVNTCLLSGEEVLGAQLASELREVGQNLAGADGDGAPLHERIGEILADRRKTLKPAHTRFVGKTMAWLASDLNPPIATLYREAGLSKRTVQRLTRRFFGVSPGRLVKRFRAIRAAMLLANPDLPQRVRDAVIDSYFDQAHMIRDIRRYTGRTPSKLSSGKIIEGTLDPDAHGEAARLLRARDT